MCPTHRDYRELAHVDPDGEYLFHDYASLALEDIAGSRAQTDVTIGDPIAEIERIYARFLTMDIAAVISTDDYPGSTLACIIAKKLGLPGPEPAVNVTCQHKYRSRLQQQRFVPDSVPQFALLDVNDSALPPPFVFPVFVKPIKSFFSIGSQPVCSQSELSAVCDRWKGLGLFFEPFDRLLEYVLGIRPDRNRLIVESLLSGPRSRLRAAPSKARRSFWASWIQSCFQGRWPLSASNILLYCRIPCSNEWPVSRARSSRVSGLTPACSTSK